MRTGGAKVETFRPRFAVLTPAGAAGRLAPHRYGSVGATRRRGTAWLSTPLWPRCSQRRIRDGPQGNSGTPSGSGGSYGSGFLPLPGFGGGRESGAPHG